MGMDVGAKKGPRSDINITPLVDVVLVLLIIFMVLTPLMEKEIGVRVPEDVPPEMQNEPPPPDLTQGVFKGDEAGDNPTNSPSRPETQFTEPFKADYKPGQAQKTTQGTP